MSTWVAELITSWISHSLKESGNKEVISRSLKAEYEESKVEDK